MHKLSILSFFIGLLSSAVGCGDLPQPALNAVPDYHLVRNEVTAIEVDPNDIRIALRRNSARYEMSLGITEANEVIIDIYRDGKVFSQHILPFPDWMNQVKQEFGLDDKLFEGKSFPVLRNELKRTTDQQRRKTLKHAMQQRLVEERSYARVRDALLGKQPALEMTAHDFEALDAYEQQIPQIMRKLSYLQLLIGQAQEQIDQMKQDLTSTMLNSSETKVDTTAIEQAREEIFKLEAKIQKWKDIAAKHRAEREVAIEESTRLGLLDCAISLSFYPAINGLFRYDSSSCKRLWRFRRHLSADMIEQYLKYRP